MQCFQGLRVSESTLMVRGGVILVHDDFGNQYPSIKQVVRKFIEGHSELHKIPIGDTMSIVIAGF